MTTKTNRKEHIHLFVYLLKLRVQPIILVQLKGQSHK